MLAVSDAEPLVYLTAMVFYGGRFDVQDLAYFSFDATCANRAATSFCTGDNGTSFKARKILSNWGYGWWEWALQFPTESNPITSDGNVDCMAGQQGKVWFLAGTFGTKADRRCTIKKNRVIFFPVINSFPWTPEDCKNLADCREVAAAFLDPLTKWTCTVDGIRCVFKSQVIRAQSDAMSIVLRPGTWVIDFYEPGVRKIAISDGYWVMLEPLPPGEHVIHFTADKPSENFALDVTYHLTVSAID